MGFDRKDVLGKESYIITNDQVALAITKQGGQMAPVTFYNDTKTPINPYFISPWQYENSEPEEPNLKILRGDFFCMPCGLPKEFKDEGFPVHGETASKDWELEKYSKENEVTELILKMETTIRKGRLNKTIRLKDNHNAIYIRHEITEIKGNFSLGHHATLCIPEEKETVILTTSQMKFGFTQPRNSDELENNGEYFFIKATERFESINKVATVWKDVPFVDCSKHPVTTGFMGLVQLYNQPGDEPAWVIAYYPEESYFWFALKDAAILSTTVLWMENKGRHKYPWNGRTRCLGIEDMCVAIGDDDLNKELRNELDRNGVVYEHVLRPDRIMTVNYIEGIQKVPKGFGKIIEVKFNNTGFTAITCNGKTIGVEVDWKFIYE